VGLESAFFEGEPPSSEGAPGPVMDAGGPIFIVMPSISIPRKLLEETCAQIP